MKCYLYLFFDDVIMDHYSCAQVDIWVVHFPFISRTQVIMIYIHIGKAIRLSEQQEIAMWPVSL